jgi:SAM-dependent methyltransferase
MTDARFSEEDVARYWNENAEAWTREVREGHDIAREFLNNPAFLELVGDLRGKQVLDAGCGEGHNTRILARRGACLTGVDISERMIALAFEEERREPLGIQYARTSYADLGMFPSGSFDAVVSFMALMEGPRFDLAMRESFRVLRPGGLLVFSITHPCFITKGLLGAGFVLKRIEEPRPSEEYCQAHPSKRGWRDHAALFLYFRAEKPT